ncbi:mannitol dehydrogenase family protein [Cryobacterium melibiosiphilum]|uniref:Mannitol-1-phosphate 5-dehydrogenase n=1 Tax=Cryobacterium melibiosiphilum TaxID=995039 RepID=A0A3A5MPI0_9MICO|nr:mannitol dehydrogenase family protein [Cryobacterium melibiosiphilum]RJT87976.1 mannitol dehydrogenase family protein [Cryobacterium melibiosiphilum]
MTETTETTGTTAAPRTLSTLGNETLAALAPAAPEVALPAYDRVGLSAGIVHFGVGGFHRAHQALMIDDLLAQGLARDWAICGVGVMPSDVRMRDALLDQDGLYTLVVKHPDGRLEARVIGSIIDYMYAPDDVEAVIERLASREVKIVSLTVTEGGYNIHPVTGEFELDSPAVAADLAADAVPATVFGIVVEALRRRRARGVVPFTIMSCDNLQDNGGVARRAFVAFATAKDADLGLWISVAVSFPSSMVDRITPVTTDNDRAQIADTFGLSDRWPVVCEPFLQWVLEDHFTDGRPPYEKTAVQLVADVEPYELMKLRLLNASHQGLCYFAHLMGYRLVHDAAADPLIATFLRAYMDREGTPTLKPVPGIDVEDYKTQLIERFSNPGVRDTVARLCAESSDRIPKWLLPVVREQSARGGEVALSAAIVASWARYAEGTDEQGQPIEVVDRIKDRVMASADGYSSDPHSFLRDEDLFGDLLNDAAFVAAYDRALELLHTVGARATLEELLKPLN